jgi:hypothetical protein
MEYRRLIKAINDVAIDLVPLGLSTFGLRHDVDVQHTAISLMYEIVHRTAIAMGEEHGEVEIRLQQLEELQWTATPTVNVSNDTIDCNDGIDLVKVDDVYDVPVVDFEVRAEHNGHYHITSVYYEFTSLMHGLQYIADKWEWARTRTSIILDDQDDPVSWTVLLKTFVDSVIRVAGSMHDGSANEYVLLNFPMADSAPGDYVKFAITVNGGTLTASGISTDVKGAGSSDVNLIGKIDAATYEMSVKLDTSTVSKAPGAVTIVGTDHSVTTLASDYSLLLFSNLVDVFDLNTTSAGVMGSIFGTTVILSTVGFDYTVDVLTPPAGYFFAGHSYTMVRLDKLEEDITTLEANLTSLETNVLSSFKIISANIGSLSETLNAVVAQVNSNTQDNAETQQHLAELDEKVESVEKIQMLNAILDLVPIVGKVLASAGKVISSVLKLGGTVKALAKAGRLGKLISGSSAYGTIAGFVSTKFPTLASRIIRASNNYEKAASQMARVGKTLADLKKEEMVLYPIVKGLEKAGLGVTELKAVKSVLSSGATVVKDSMAFQQHANVLWESVAQLNDSTVDSETIDVLLQLIFSGLFSQSV